MFAILLIALALCVDSFTVSAATSFSHALPLRRGLVMAGVFAFCQGVTPLLGALLGVGFQDVMSALDHWVAFGLLLLVGGKMMVDAWRGDSSRNNMDPGKTSVLFVLGVATSIDAFVVGVGLGLEHSWRYMLVFVATVFVSTFLLSLLGYALGHRQVLVPEKPAGIIAGLVLMALGAYTLFEHLAMGV